MIESILFFSLGFLCAGFLALMVAPSIWRRAVSMTRRRIEASVPLSLSDIEADKDLLEYLWRADVRPGRRLRVVEVAPWAGTITASGDGRTIALGLPAAGKIWVYQPAGATA